MDGIRERLGRAATRPLPCALALGIVYYALSRLSLAHVSSETGAATLWPACGVALAALALAPRRWWPALTGAVFVGDLVAQVEAREDLAMSAPLAAVSALEALAAAYVLVRIAGPGRIDITSVRTVSGIAAAASGVNAITALLGTAVLIAAVGGPLGQTWASWWLADGVGMLVIAPLLLALVQPRPGRASRLETIALVWLATAVAFLLFAHHPGDGPVPLGYAFPLLPMLLWCALRLGTRATTVAILSVSLVAAICTAHGSGAFAVAQLSEVERAQALQAFLALAVLSTLLVGAVVAGQRRLEQLAADEADRLASVLRASDAAIIALDLRGTITHFNAGAERMTGYTAGEMVGSRSPGLHDPEQLAARAAELGLQPNFEVFIRAAMRSERRDWTWITKDGRRLTVSQTMTARRDQAGHLIGFLGVASDVTDRRESERRLAASEERHRAVLANFPDAQIYLYDRDLVCVLGEGRAISDEVDESQYLGRSVHELLADDPAHLVTYWERALDGEATHTTYRSPHTGSYHELHVLPHPDGVLVVMRDVTDRKRFEERLRHLAEHDPLTGVLNRRRLDQELVAHVARVSRYGAAGAVLLVDVDGFKRVNDTQGHAAGDALVVAVARVLGNRLRSSDALARLGGDEFAILLPQGGVEDARTVAHALVEAVRRETGVTISVGVAPVGDVERLTAEDLMRDADRAMYAAKAAGGDGYAIAGESVITSDRAASAARPSR